MLMTLIDSSSCCRVRRSPHHDNTYRLNPISVATAKTPENSAHNSNYHHAAWKTPEKKNTEELIDEKTITSTLTSPVIRSESKQTISDNVHHVIVEAMRTESHQEHQTESSEKTESSTSHQSESTVVKP
jgi:hypothetical protein